MRVKCEQHKIIVPEKLFFCYSAFIEEKVANEHRV